MKRALIASILGIAASAATAFGQGQIAMSSYINSSSQVLFRLKTASGPLATGYNMQMYYAVGSNVPFGSMTALPVVATVNSLGWAASPTIPTFTYGSGPVTFAFVGFNGATWASSNPDDRTQPSDVWTWTEPSVSSLPSPSGFFTYPIVLAAATARGDIGPDGFPVVIIPEPGTLALAGLGAAALLIFRKRQ